MTFTRKDITALLTHCAAQEMDAFLLGYGFSRRERALSYFRYTAEGTQSLEMLFDFNPAYKPGAIACLVPQLRVNLPVLNIAVTEMLSGDLSLVGSVEPTFFQMVQNAAPSRVRSVANDWYVYDDVTAVDSVARLREYVQRWSVAFLESHRTVASLVKSFEAGDERLPQDRRFVLFIVAAYTVLGMPSKARELLESRLGMAGSRRQCASVFHYVDALLG
ncbi:MAG: hypothetical protein ACRCT8_16040 [Lacipirellulaceae bacterium]